MGFHHRRTTVGTGVGIEGSLPGSSVPRWTSVQVSSRGGGMKTGGISRVQDAAGLGTSPETPLTSYVNTPPAGTRSTKRVSSPGSVATMAPFLEITILSYGTGLVH